MPNRVVQPPPKKKLIRYSPIACAVVIGVVLSFFLFTLVGDWGRTKLQIEFESRAKAYANAVHNALNEYLGVSEFIKDYFDTGGKVSRSQFSRFASSALARYPGVQALSWNPVVKAVARPEYVRQARSEGLADFRFTERASSGRLVLAAERQEYVVVYYIEPLAKNRPALGFDIASNAVRRQAIDRAFITGKPVASARITLVQETGNQFGVLILNPVYRLNDPPETHDARRMTRKGLAVEVLRIGDAIDSGLRGLTDADVHLYLYDVTAKNEEQFLYARPLPIADHAGPPANTAALKKGLHLTTALDFAERRYSLVLLPSAAFLKSQKSIAHWVVLFVGICLSGLLMVYLFDRLRHIDEIELRIARETVTKQQLADSEKLHRATIENISDAVFITDDQGAFTYICPNTRVIFGVTTEEVIALGNIQALFNRSIFDIGELRRKSELFNIEVIVKDSKGREHFLLVNVKQVAIKNGTILFTCRDISERKKAEDSLRESEERFKRLFENAPLPYQSLDKNGDIIAVNQTWLDVLQHQRSDVIGKSFAAFLNPAWEDHFRENFPRFKTIGEILGIEFEMRKGDGTFIPVRFDGRIGKNRSGEFIQTHCVFRDVSKEMKLQKRIDEQQAALRQSQKLDSIGHLAGGIAHDFNNILSSIIGFTELALDDVDKGSQVASSLKEVYTAGKRAKDLVKQILAFARQSDEERRPIRPATVAREAIKLIRSTIPSSIEIHPAIESQALIMGNATQLNQIFLNLCTNAAQAMEVDGGVLTITLRDITVSSFEISPLAGLLPGRYIEITVADTGVGIAPEIIESIYDPYFSTKQPGEGTGLGLAMVHGIIESYQGKISVASKKGEGTVFTVYLPSTEKREPYPVYETRELPMGNERILLVDDEAPIVRMESQILKRLGYHVTTRTSSLDALELFRSQPAKFDLCISDMTMPNMSGDKLAVELMKIRPDLPVILCSGYSKRMSEEMASRLGIRAYAYKPVVKADLARTVRKVLDEARSAKN